MKGSQQHTYRSLPSVDALLRSDVGKEVAAAAGTERATTLARNVIDQMRHEIANEIAADLSTPIICAQALLIKEWQRIQRRSQRRVINASGVIIHTNLGRSPLSRTAAEAVFDSASGYCSIEYDLESGKRGKRGGYTEDLLCQLTGAEAALVVNNCAAAAFLVLTAFASGGEVIISRGELVEIGGDFRVPDVLVQSGARLREVGTTNRTKLSDYEKAIGEKTRMILRVHPSNYRVVGFTSAPSIKDLAGLAHASGLVLYDDAGSGALIDLQRFGVGGEPIISESLDAGADIVTFSGDKLLGGPQSGLIVGREQLIDQLRGHPLYRAIRADKLVYAALQATLESYIHGTAKSEIPVHAMLSATPESVRERAERFAIELRKVVDPTVDVSVRQDVSAVGGGAAPTVQLPTWLVSVAGPKRAEKVAGELRSAKTPVIARVSEEKLLVDLRTVLEGEENSLLSAVKEALDT